MKKLIAGFLIALTSAVASANTKLNLVTHYPPGGTVDTLMQQVKTILTSKNFDVEVIYVKTCGEAMNIRDKNKNTIQVMFSSDFRPGDSNAVCVMDPRQDSINLVASFTSNPYYICNAPGKNFTVDNFKEEITIGIVRDTDEYASYLLENFPSKTNVKLLPYRGGSLLAKAITAGDVEMWIGSTGAIRRFPESNCIGSTVKDDVRGKPFLGSILNKPLIEIRSVDLFFAKNNNLTSDVINSFKELPNSPDLKLFLEKGNISAVKNSPEDVLKEVINLYNTTKK